MVSINFGMDEQIPQNEWYNSNSLPAAAAAASDEHKMYI